MDAKKSIWDEMTNKYSLSKTLRFELKKPIGKTQEFIEKNGLIEEDEQRNKDFLCGKELLEGYYSDLIERRLGKIEIDSNLLEEYFKKYKEFNKLKQKGKEVDAKELKNSKDSLKASQRKLREELHKSFFDNDALFKDEEPFKEKRDNEDVIIAAVKFHRKKLLEKRNEGGVDNNLEIEEDKINCLYRFVNDHCTTYFTKFFNNRKNVFSDKAISTSIFYRTIHENLHFFVKNIENFEKLSEIIDEKELLEIEKELQKELGMFNLKEVFNINYFNNCLNQKGIDKYNQIISGVKKKDIQKEGLNNLINKLSQKKDKDQEERKNIRKLRMIQLYKQILSEPESKSFKIESIENGKELEENIFSFYKSIALPSENQKESVLTLLEKLFDSDELDFDGIYVKQKSINKISNKIHSDWYLIESALKERYKSKIKSTGKKDKTDLQKEKETKKWFKETKHFSINEINSAIEFTKNDLITKENKDIWKYFKGVKTKEKNLFNEIQTSFGDLKKVKFGKERELLYDDNEENVVKIKKALDYVQELFWLISPLMYEKPKEGVFDLDLNPDFYEKFVQIYEELQQITPLYNKTRNFISQKPHCESKFKLNFGDGYLLNGWAEKDGRCGYRAVIFRQGNKYYLGIIAKGKKNTKMFDKIPNYKSGDYYEKMKYNQLQKPDQNLPRIFFAPSNEKYYNPSEEIKSIKNKGSFRTNIEDCHKMIEFYKKSISKKSEWDIYKFKFKETNDYVSIDEFYKDFSNQAYKIEFQKISVDDIHELVDSGKLYLFTIYNKDFSEKKFKKDFSKRKPNLHTMYWKELFSDENLKNVVYQLNGGAEIFFRKKSPSNKKIIHIKNKAVPNEKPINGRKESTFEYDLIKDKRYFEDKYLFHCPITLNFKSEKNNVESFNNYINEFIVKNNDEINILGLDRGERNLLYYYLLNPNGEKIKSGSFNIFKDEFGREFDYHKMLSEREDERDKDQKEWKNIKNIKDLKEGYLSRIIHEISKIVIDNNAIVVLEDLNPDFKRNRFKFENQVYQKFEEKLIKKLNYLVFKNRKSTDSGGLFRAYQLTSKFVSFKNLREQKQSGILYYVNANYTSKIDPKTGFVNLLYPNYKNIEKSKLFFDKFDSIKYNKSENMFEFEFDYSNFTKNLKLKKNNWTVFTNGERIIQVKTKNNIYEPKKINLTNEMKNLFESEGISFNDGKNLKEEIINSNSKKLHTNLTNLLKYTLQLRNSNNKTGEDYILSCVKDDEKNFFNSNNAKDSEPENADANGAYHIGLKGIMLIKKMKKQSDKNQKIDLRISNEEYFNEMCSKEQSKKKES
ncbi:MAG: hypothetical protein BWY55_00351 [archaeon ADurb.Bin336]|nr:MAG: hypothetical protein BWY55_00351 [archaeon ADurb.Bin336]